MVQDAEAGIRFLTQEQRIPPFRIALIGGELGCSIAFQAMSRNPRLRAAVALTPARAYFEIPTLAHVKKYGQRPLLLVTTKQYLFDGAQDIADALRSNPGVKLQVYPKMPARGVELLGMPIHLDTLIVDWLGRVFGSKPIQVR